MAAKPERIWKPRFCLSQGTPRRLRGWLLLARLPPALQVPIKQSQVLEKEALCQSKTRPPCQSHLAPQGLACCSHLATRPEKTSCLVCPKDSASPRERGEERPIRCSPSAAILQARLDGRPFLGSESTVPRSRAGSPGLFGRGGRVRRGQAILGTLQTVKSCREGGGHDRT
jgi:hypothetical protein